MYVEVIVHFLHMQEVPVSSPALVLAITDFIRSEPVGRRRYGAGKVSACVSLERALSVAVEYQFAASFHELTIQDSSPLAPPEVPPSVPTLGPLLAHIARRKC